MKPNIDLLIIADHLAVECGVKTQYLKLIQRCYERKLNIALISDIRMSEIPPFVNKALCITVEDQKKGVFLKRRPFLATDDILDHTGSLETSLLPEILHSDLATIKWTDAWIHSNEWVAPTMTRIDEFIASIEYKNAIIATQSFLGFASVQLKLQNCSLCIHTDYGAFYASRMCRSEDSFIFEKIKYAINNRIAKEFLSKHSRIFFPSEYVIDGINSEVSSENWTYRFPGGVDTKLFRKKGHYRSNKTIKVLFVGRLSQEKGIGILSRAAKSLPNARWTIIGDGPLKTEVANASENIKILGTVPQIQVSAEMQKNEIFLFLGSWDTFGLSALEAMSCGMAIICVNGSGISKIISEISAGIVISNLCDELTNAISTLAANPHLRKQMGKNGREYAKKNTWDKVCDKFLRDVGVIF